MYARYSLLPLLLASSVFAGTPSALMVQACALAVSKDSGAVLSPADDYKAGVCVGFLKGMSDNMYLHATPSSLKMFFCIKRGTNTMEMAQAYVTYMKAHPNGMNLDASITMPIAIHNTYPCYFHIRGLTKP